MNFKSLLSQKQINSIFYFIIGIIALFFLTNNSKGFIFVIQILILSMIMISIFNFISETRRKYIISHPYQKNNYDSKKEEIIAEYFKNKNIIFVHNKIIKVPKQFWIFNLPFVYEKIKPDFFLPEFNVYVEYCGLMDDEKYKQNYQRKKKLYLDNNLDVLWLYEKDLYQKYEKDYSRLDWCFTQKLLEIFKTREGINRYF